MEFRMNFNASVAMLLIFTISACVSITESKPAKLTGAEINKVTAVVKSGLRDPNSAEFSNISAQDRVYSDGSKNTVICGLVNAKNGFGGYTGSSAFSAFRDANGNIALGVIDNGNDVGIARHGHCQTFTLP